MNVDESSAFLMFIPEKVIYDRLQRRWWVFHMLDIIALLIAGFSFLMLLYSLTKMKKETSDAHGGKSRTLGKLSTSAPSGPESIEDIEGAPPMEEEIMDRPSIVAHEKREMLAKPSITPESDFTGESIDVRGRSTDARTIERKASLTYWERMCLEEEFDLVVTLHRPEFKVQAPEGASVHESETVYKLPTTGHVRIIPVCAGCNISPAYRDMKVSEFAYETRAEFKVLPLKEGEYDLNVEFQLVQADGQLSKLGIESTRVTVQKKPIELDLRFMNISVSRRVPAFFSMCGSLFGFTSFTLARLGINLNEEIVAWSATISTGLAGAVMILLAMMLLFKGLKPLMNEIDITFG
jgi:hypothetical protein